VRGQFFLGQGVGGFEYPWVLRKEIEVAARVTDTDLNQVKTTVLVGTSTLYMSNTILPRQNDLFLKAPNDVGVS